MSTDTITLTPASGVPWFRLDRHDGDPAPVDTEDPRPESGDEDAEAQRLLADAANGDPEGDGTTPDPDDDEEPDGLGDAGKKALARMKADRAAAKKEAAAAKKQAADERRRAADLAKKVQEYEDSKKSDLEKAQALAERSAEQAAKAVARSVRSEIKVAAAGRFADATDAVDVLMRDPSRYVDTDGEIDTDAIEADLVDLLERKPHWGVSAPAPAVEPETPRKPRPKADPAQGSRGPVPPTDFRTASEEDVQAELNKIGFRKRF